MKKEYNYIFHWRVIGMAEPWNAPRGEVRSPNREQCELMVDHIRQIFGPESVKVEVHLSERVFYPLKMEKRLYKERLNEAGENIGWERIS